MEHLEYEELLTLHALDALDAPDRRKLEEHLESCSVCRAELAEMRDAAGLLAHASTAVEPGAEVRERILSSIRAEGHSAKASEVNNVVPIAPQRKANAPSYWLKIAAGIALVGLIFWLVSVFLVQNHKISNLTAQIEAQRWELEREREARRRDQEALALLNSRDSRRMDLTGTAQAQNARAVFIFDQKSGKAMLMTDGLPMAPAGMAYEVWFIPKGQAPMPGKTFTVDPAGKAMMMDEMPAAARENAVVAITLEPEKGSASPTGAIYLASPAS
ncbi:MAG TPA: anti-sigma factor [Pyrinomonadaceae bacterium]